MKFCTWCEPEFFFGQSEWNMSPVILVQLNPPFYHHSTNPVFEKFSAVKINKKRLPSSLSPSLHPGARSVRKRKNFRRKQESEFFDKL